MLAQKVALVSGTSSGIGLRTSVQLVKAGFLVVATMRDLTKRSALDTAAAEAGVTVDVRALDVQSDESVAAGVAGVLERYGRIDLLVNNAGAGFLGTFEQTSMADAQRVFDINYFGVVRLTKAVLPSMREARTGRIVTVTSVGGVMGQAFNDHYCGAKAAVENMFESLAPVVQRFGIHCSLIEPGPVRTEFVANVEASVGSAAAAAATGAAASSKIDADYAPMLASYRAAVATAYDQYGQSADEVAQVIVEAATADKPHFRYPTSQLMHSLIGAKYTDTTGDKCLAIAGARLPPL